MKILLFSMGLLLSTTFFACKKDIAPTPVVAGESNVIRLNTANVTTATSANNGLTSETGESRNIEFEMLKNEMQPLK